MNRLRLIAVVVFILFLAPIASAEMEPCEREFRTGALIIRLDQIALTGAAASQLDGTENPKLKKLLLLQLASAAEGARDHVEGGAILPKQSITSLKDSIERARAFAVYENLTSVTADLDVVLSAFTRR